MFTLILATRNRHKVEEIRAVLGLGFRYASLLDFPNAPETIEDQETFAGNASKKVSALATWLTSNASGTPLNFLVLSDDSGLEVRTLAWAPGVLSARFAALDSDQSGNSTDNENSTKLLRLMTSVPPNQRQARFRCVLALRVAGLTGNTDSIASDSVEFFEGVCPGRIAFESSGKGGFGYDPLFVPDGFEQTFAELKPEQKNQISHRARALAKLKERLKAVQFHS